jgi:hypothetical protein
LRIEEAGPELGLSAEEVDSLLVLRDLRNKVAHTSGAQISWEDAKRFQTAAARLLGRLKLPRDNEQSK